MLQCNLQDVPTMRQGCVPTALAAVTGIPCSRWIATGRAIGGPDVFKYRGVRAWEMWEMANRMGFGAVDVLKKNGYGDPVTLQKALRQCRGLGPVVLLTRYGRYGHAIAAEDFLVYDTYVKQPTWFADWQFRYTTWGRWDAKKGGHVLVYHAFLLDKKALTNAGAPAIVSQ